MAYCAVYLNRILREKDRPEKAEDPLVLEKDIPIDATFSYIDFVPSCLSYIVNDVEFHSFDHLLETANKWLSKNSQWQVVNVETVRLIYKHNLTNMVSRWEQQINPTSGQWTAAAYRGGEFLTSLKVLRIWLRRKDDDDDNNDNYDEEIYGKKELKYLDFIPQKISGNNFENIDTMIGRLNERLRKSDAQKWILISIQSLKIEANSDWNIGDLQCSLAEESSRSIVILRLYYHDWNVSDHSLWKSPYIITVGIEDFKPRHLSGGSFFKRPQFEPFSSLVQRSGKWLTNQNNVQFLNAQSLDIKVKSFTKIDSKSTSHIEHGDYIQILRVCYCRLTPRSPEPSTSSLADLTFFPIPDTFHALTSAASSLKLGSKTILTTKFEHPLDSLQHRITDWLNSDQNLDVCPLSAETVDIFAKDDDELKLEKMLEECFQSNRLGNLNTYAFTGIRLFYCILPEQMRPLHEAQRSRSAQSLFIDQSAQQSKIRKCSKRRASTKPISRSSKSVRLKHQQTLTRIEFSGASSPPQTHLLKRPETDQFDESQFLDLVSDSDLSPPPIRQRNYSNSCLIM